VHNWGKDSAGLRVADWPSSVLRPAYHSRIGSMHRTPLLLPLAFAPWKFAWLQCSQHSRLPIWSACGHSWLGRASVAFPFLDQSLLSSLFGGMGWLRSTIEAEVAANSCAVMFSRQCLSKGTLISLLSSSPAFLLTHKTTIFYSDKNIWQAFAQKNSCVAYLHCAATFCHGYSSLST